jgi:hypothetical protein
VGFTKLPELTKQELLRVGLKNRALLRTLLTTPVEKHPLILEEAAAKEEILTLSTTVDPNAPKVVKEKKEPKPFAYEMNDKGLKVPGFTWKTGEGNEKLTVYLDALKKLSEQIEDRLTK